MASVTVFVVFVVFACFAVLVQGDDAPCLEKHGKCQTDTLHCGGGYQSGMCSGAANRRCCLPAASSPCKQFETVTRSEWGARAPKSRSHLTPPVNKFFIHHTASATCSDKTSCISSVKGFQIYHMDIKGWSDIAYSFLVGGDGRVYIGRGWETVGAHTQGYNSVSYAASMIGSFMTSLPTSQALSAVKNLIACGVEIGQVTSSYRLFGHRDAGQTDCPGNALYAEIQTWPHYSHSHP